MKIFSDIEKRAPENLDLREKGQIPACAGMTAGAAKPKSREIPVRKKDDLKSRHVLDLRKRPEREYKLKPAGDKVKIYDVKSPETFWQKWFQQDPDDIFARRKRRGQDLFRLAVAGVMVVFALNAVNVFYRAVDVKNDLVTSAYQGFEELMKVGGGVRNADFTLVSAALEEALENFEAAQNQLWFIESQKASFGGGPGATETATALLDSGRLLSEAGIYFTEVVNSLSALTQDFLEAEGTDSLTENLKVELSKVELALDNLQAAQANLAKVNTLILPKDVRPKLVTARAQIDEALTTAEKMKEFWPAVLKLLGDRYPYRYLILLQNNNEIRPTGGFIGSYILVDMNDGKMSDLDVHDIYERDGLLGEAIEAPEEIAKLTGSNWRMRDANYSPDFAVSAQKVAWFLEKQKGPGVDVVVAVDLELAEKILEATGPVNLREIEFNSDNFVTLLTYIVEAKLEGKNNPKQILKDFIPAVEGKLRETQNWRGLVAVLEEAVKEKHLQVYAKDEEVQGLLSELSVTGKVVQPAADEDYFAVVNTSIGGNKSDTWMEQEVQHRTFVHADGSVIDQVTVTRRHTWSKVKERQLLATLGQAGFYDVPEFLKDILGRYKNLVGMRVYVPKGTQLLEVEGIDPEEVLLREDQDLGLTYFYTKLGVFPQNEVRVTLTYRLPFKLDLKVADEYHLQVQKQAGMAAEAWTKEIYLDPRVKGYRFYPGMTETEEGYQKEMTLTSDMEFAGLVGRR